MIEWYGPHCTSRYDDCQGGSQALCEHGICIDSDRVQPGQPKYKCICDNGWMSPPGSPACTADIDECSLPDRPCSTNPPVECFNTMGSYYCGPCPAGYEGDGRICTQADICSVNNGGCHPLASCASNPVCGGYLNGLAGTFSYPNTPGSDEYDHQVSCAWVIRTDSDKILRITFLFFHLESSSGCNYDFLQIHDGDSASGFMIGKYCGTAAPAELFSSHNSLYFWFRSDHSINAGGFTVAWESREPVCGGYLNGLAGTFSYPNTPGSDEYDHQVSCAWVIRTDSDKILRITFPFFHLESSSGCNYDFLQIHDGDSASGFMIGKYCGTAAPAELFSSHNSLYFWFRSDHSINAGGFTVAWESREPDCGEVYTAPTGTLTSPNYPNNYPNSRQCIYKIIVETNRQIMLNFTDFILEHTYPSCSFDHIEIRDGGYETSPLIGKYCGTYTPPLVISHSNRLWIKFSSDVTVTYKGFMAHWDGTLSGCGGTLTTSTGSFTSPNYPLPYHPNAECYWLLKTNPGSQIQLQFSDFHLESSTNCMYDYLAVYNGNSTNAMPLAKLCGNLIPAPIQSTWESLYVKLRTDQSIGAGGFVATYNQVCQGVVIANRSRGVLESPNYPNTYPHGKRCSWTIQATAGNTINYTFTAFDLEVYCTYDYVKLYDGPNDQSNLIGTFCGNTPPPANSTTGTSLHVVFVSDPSVSRSGFQMLWYQNGCGGELFGPHGLFNSPGYPSRYPDNRECIWHIQAAPESSIQITIHEFDVEYHPDCSYDVLEVYGGPDVSSPRLAQLCTTRPPNQPLQVSSTGNFVTVRFKTDHYISGKGFNASWQEVQGGCGGVFTAPSGEIHSPNYPNPYSVNVDCSWIINVDQGHRVLLTFNDFDIENHDSCGYDYLAVTCGSVITTDDIGGAIASPMYPNNYPSNQNCSWIIQAQEPFNHVTLSFTVFSLENKNGNCTTDVVEILDGNNYEAPSVGRYCGTAVPHPATSFSNALVVNFISNGQDSDKGFRATYGASTSVYGNEITGSAGQIASPLWPRDYPDNADYRWTITVNADYFIRVWIFEMDVEDTYECYFDKLKIFDGPSVSFLQLGTFCGLHPPPPVSSSGSSMTLEFQSDDSVSGRGFMLEWLAIEASGALPTIAPGSCGGALMTGDSPSFLFSPGWPNDYQNNLECTWVIRSPDSTVELNILSVDIESHNSCFYDSLVIRDGETNVSPLLATVCGRELPGPIRSTGDAMFIRFTADGSYSGGGFNASYHKRRLLGKHCGNIPPSSVDTSDSYAYVKFVSDASVSASGFSLRFDASVEECGGDLNAASGTITSPNYPNLYPHSRLCEWRITVPEGRRVTLTINDLRIEEHQNCNYDYVAVYNGILLSAPMLARYCGDVDSGTQVKSSGNTMAVVFVTDASVSNGGFSADYTSDEEAVCGGILNVPDGGNFTSPGYDGESSYANNLNCEWIIQNPSHLNSSISISFDDFHLEHHLTCEWDYIEFRIGNANGELLARFCGQSVPAVPLVVYAPQIWVHFLSDYTTGDIGFLAKYVFTGCGGLQTGVSGVVASPSYPSPYDNVNRCAWLLEAPEGHTITLTFTYFDVEPHTECKWDSVTIMNGGSSGSPVIGQYCGTNSPGTIQSGSNKLVVVFVSDHSVQAGGFYATWTTDSSGCGGTIHADSGTIKSPGYPQNFPTNSECTWRIIAHEGNHLEMSFSSDFEIPDSSGLCQSSYVKVWGGPAEVDERLLATGCGTAAPASLIAPGNMITTRFQTQGLVGKGFSAAYTTPHSTCTYDGLKIYSGTTNTGSPITTLCGSQIPGPFTTAGPMLLNFYSDSVIVYKGFLAKYEVIRKYLHSTLYGDLFNSFHLEASSNCAYDYIAVYDGANTQAPLLGKFCGMVIPSTLKSSSNNLFLVFKTDYSVNAGGWRATFRQTLGPQQGCGGYLTSPSGSFGSPDIDFDGKYEASLDCVWNIVVPQNMNVNLTFSNFILEGPSGTICRYDYVKVFDGDNENFPLVGTFCGTTVPASFASSNNFLTVKFVSDSSVSFSGFNATYTAVECK
ncbi:UNVERIFIED_CONTAM: hypothetical protein FKN15_032572 [Acipenser sinensis]